MKKQTYEIVIHESDLETLKNSNKGMKFQILTETGKEIEFVVRLEK